MFEWLKSWFRKKEPAVIPAADKPKDPAWVTIAQKYIGMKEVVGNSDNDKIVELWKIAKTTTKVSDDETPWCAAFVSACIEQAGFTSARTGWARSYLNWGLKLQAPVRGCVVVFSRGSIYGHVGFYMGRASNGKMLILGGNQNNEVGIVEFDDKTVLGYRWPKS